MPLPASTSPRLYLSPPHTPEREMQYIQEAFDSNWVAPLGPRVDAFEHDFWLQNDDDALLW